MADLSITLADVVPGSNAQYIDAVAATGVTIDAGDVFYRDASDSYKAKLSDANLSEAAASAAAIAVNKALPGQPVRGVFAGDLDLGSILTQGLVYIVSGTAGKICPSADLASGWYPTVLGVATDGNTLKVGIVHGTGAKA